MKQRKQKQGATQASRLSRYIKRPVVRIGDKVRKARKLNPHRSFRLTGKHIKPRHARPLTSAWRLLLESWKFILANKKVLLGLIAIYIVISWLAIGIASQSDYADYRDVVDQVSAGDTSSLETVGTLLLSSLSGTYISSVSELQQFVATLCSFLFLLIIIWAVRNISGGQKVTLREALYNGPAPFVSSLTVTSILLLQMVPGALGVLVLTLANGRDFTDAGVIAMAFAGAAILLIALSLYWVVGTLLGAVIVTLPNMYPIAALSLAKQLVLGRRFAVFTRVFVLVLFCILVWSLILAPVIAIDARFKLAYLPLVPITLQILGGFTLLVSSVYTYKLYRDLL